MPYDMLVKYSVDVRLSGVKSKERSVTDIKTKAAFTQLGGFAGFILTAPKRQKIITTMSSRVKPPYAPIGIFTSWPEIIDSAKIVAYIF